MLAELRAELEHIEQAILVAGTPRSWTGQTSRQTPEVDGAGEAEGTATGEQEQAEGS